MGKGKADGKGPTIEACGNVMIRDTSAYSYVQVIAVDFGSQPHVKKFKTNKHKWQVLSVEYVQIGNRKWLLAIQVAFVSLAKHKRRFRDTDQVTVTVTNGSADVDTPATTVHYVDPS